MVYSLRSEVHAQGIIGPSLGDRPHTVGLKPEPQPGPKIIEMFGDPGTADVILSFVPGTNTTMESFYTSTDNEGITALTKWQVDNPLPGAAVAGFVVKQGPFPDLGLGTGPWVNFYAAALGSRYVKFDHQLDVITSGTPVVSAEHSFGSGVAGAAEHAGADFAARYMLAPIGMASGWERRDGTKYYSAQGPGDINRYVDGVQVGPLFGYAIEPCAENGLNQRPTGYTVDLEPQHFLFPASGIGLMVETALDEHKRSITADETVNGPVMRDMRQVLVDAAQR